MSGQGEIQIVDVILTKNYFGEYKHYNVVVDRMPEYVFTRGEREPSNWASRYQHRLLGQDGGLYRFLVERPGSTGAFAGGKFTIQLDDGGTLECHGQVWDENHPGAPEPTVEVGVATLEKLRNDYYCFYHARISKAKLDAWLASNTPSRNYRKYDPKHTIEALDKEYAAPSWGDRTVCAARARKLRQRGVTIRKRGEARTWSKWYERRKAEILHNLTLDEVAP